MKKRNKKWTYEEMIRSKTDMAAFHRKPYSFEREDDKKQKHKADRECYLTAITRMDKETSHLTMQLVKERESRFKEEWILRDIQNKIIAYETVKEDFIRFVLEEEK